MSIFSRKNWIEDDPECTYEHNVVPFPSRHARANAAQAAQLLEDDRRATRQAEIKVLIDGYEADVSKLQHVIACLREEHLLLELRRG